jgi:hypothetical protein
MNAATVVERMPGMLLMQRSSVVIKDEGAGRRLSKYHMMAAVIPAGELPWLLSAFTTIESR